MPHISHSRIEEVCTKLLEAYGTPHDEAALVGHSLASANLAGHDSHGILRMPRYLEGLEDGKWKPGSEIQIVKEAPAMAVLDGAWNFGQVVARKAAEMAIEKARSTAVAVVTAHHCNHVGRLAEYCRLAAEANCIGIMTVNGHGGDIGVAPHGGTDRRLPTNPLGVGFPTGKDFPFVLDMTTSVVAGGKLRVAISKGESTPEGMLLDSKGEPTTNPQDYFDGGCSLSFGGYKGFGLSLVVDVLSGALNQAGCSHADSTHKANAFYFQAVNIEAFTTMEEFFFQTDRLIDHVKGSPLAGGVEEIQIPGEASHRREQMRREKGIEVDDATWNSLNEFAGKKGIEL